MRRGVLLASLAALLCFPVTDAGAQGSAEDFGARRARMVAEIEALARETRVETGRERFSERVMAAMAKVHRHQFVPPELVRDAYRNSPLPIGRGKTISQPYIVALSTDLAEPQPDHVVLEIGTGSGYQAAVLAEIVRQVYTIELLEPLGRQAAMRLADGLPERRSARRRWLPGLARARALRFHRRHGGCAEHSASAGGTTQARREAGDSGRWHLGDPGTARRHQTR